MDYNFQNKSVERSFNSTTELQRSLLLRVFLWMTSGLVLTGLSSLITLNTPLFNIILQSRLVFWGILIFQIILVVILSGKINTLSFSSAVLIFAAYSILTGVSLSPLFLVFTQTSIAQTFFITAGTFGAMAVYGFITKNDLSKIGSILFMALIGIIIASVVNIFLASQMMDFIISLFGVIIFTGLTAWDTQKIKNNLANFDEDNDSVRKYSIMGALELYLDFINIFLYLLRLFGNRK